ncbi:FKBP-type peptidyl-prolyl cis-trans isomerase [Serratia microhaemolytica]|uniref:FKBP-type peptidyl-prolyl cis-trans isomerase n=1 Tax=Serratia microhaemolytica TaxID=2675110 RepID=UPI000FDDD135|nr:FKBP-type peptidyl-prolyl cis-trans isomerase [Serratia microhaemolytica]
MTTQVNANRALLAHFTLKLADGSTAESSLISGKPALFRFGDGSLSAELEQQLIGLAVGDKVQFTLPAQAAFGLQNPDLIQFFSHQDFHSTGVPEVGTIMLFNAIDGSELPGLVREVTAQSITVDFNHPLAGQAVSFDIEVLEIDPQQEPSDANTVS